MTFWLPGASVRVAVGQRVLGHSCLRGELTGTKCAREELPETLSPEVLGRSGNRVL